ncbi:MAG TPA: glycosyltransferase family 2 protein [Puia sp.]|nr:glycosyltransferase family 2 protein [Puia sp.]
MILSVVIVSYNVKYFLEQCLSSLKKAIEGIPALAAEVFIIDNASSDGSPDFLEPLFPDFHFIRNKENIGFARANNEMIRGCKGEFVLFLNPDTIVAEDSLAVCISFLRDHADAGALGVRMIDGAGRFLRESKRGFPYPATSFFKMTGLSRLFPRSKTFSSYYMGHLDDDSTQKVEVLSGAFMMIKKSVLDKTGGFDEQFFMYAEDIDLSYRIDKAGLSNYYLPATTIIHFKGESTQKDIRYVKMFYSAMQLFIKKHFGRNGPSFRLNMLILGLRLRQVLSVLRLPFKKSTDGPKTGTSVFIRGNPNDIEKLKQKLVACGIRESDVEKTEDAIILCENNSLPWKTIISTIRTESKKRLYYFHGEGTHSLVGSHAEAKQGQVIVL